MLFIYEQPDFHRITAREYQFPVDLIWLDEAKRVLFTAEKVPPCTGENCPSYGPASEKDRYVIVTKTGFLAQERLPLGASLRFALQL
jgi:uncharacterized protein